MQTTQIQLAMKTDSYLQGLIPENKFQLLSHTICCCKYLVLQYVAHHHCVEDLSADSGPTLFYHTRQ